MGRRGERGEGWSGIGEKKMGECWQKKDKGREVYKRRGGWQINEMGEKAGAGGGRERGG